MPLKPIRIIVHNPDSVEVHLPDTYPSTKAEFNQWIKQASETTGITEASKASLIMYLSARFQKEECPNQWRQIQKIVMLKPSTN